MLLLQATCLAPVQLKFMRNSPLVLKGRKNENSISHHARALQSKAAAREDELPTLVWQVSCRKRISSSCFYHHFALRLAITTATSRYIHLLLVAVTGLCTLVALGSWGAKAASDTFPSAFVFVKAVHRGDAWHVSWRLEMLISVLVLYCF